MIIIGLQIDLLPLGAAETEGAELIVPVIKEAVNHYDVIAAARFSHPAEHKMFVANYPWRRPGQEIEVMGEKILLKHYYCIQNSFGAELASGLESTTIDFTAWMGTDQKLLPHSAFFDENRQLDTGLADFLRSKQVDEIHLAGLPYTDTVFQTALDGLELGFEVGILKNAVVPKPAEKARELTRHLKKMGIQFL